MLAKHKKLPNIAGLTERPAPIKSGKPLKERVKICYRSELYMQEQQKNVVMFQEQLRQALNDLKTAKPDSLLFHTSRVEELKVKGDEMIIILQICGKINRELVYARQDLLKAVETGADSKVINKRRKRVQWLESKLEQIILQHSPARQDDNDDEQIDMDSADRSSDLGNKQSAMSSYPPDMSRLQTADSNGRLNTAGTGGSQFQVSVNGAIQDIGIIGASLGGNRLVLNGGTQDVIAEQQSREDQYEFTPSLSRGMSLSASQARLTQSKLSFREPIEDDIHSVDNRPDTSQFGDKEDSGGYDDDVDDEEEGGTESDRDYGDTSGNKSRVSQMSAVSSLFTDVTDEAARRTRRSQRSKPRTQQDVTQRPGVTREPSRVTVKSPLPPTTFVKAGRDDGHGEEYWMSEHHRVEFSALAPFLEEMDPNSLHQVAIAVPGNYVRKPSSGRHATLPWREVEDNRDINREALDRLSNQILSIQDKVYEAAIKSVDSLGARMQTRASRRDFSSMAKSRVGRSAMPSRQNQTTILSMPGLPGDQEENDNRYTPMVHMKYYSKEIPKAKVLPISRVNRNRVYPQSLTAFAFPDPDGRPAPERLVNQGRLYNDTKLVIYRAPNRKRPDTIKVKRVVTTTTQPGSPTKSNPLSQSAPNMLNKTPSSISLRTASKMAYALGAINKAKVDTPKTYHSGLKWDRVQYLYKHSLKSGIVEERQDAAKQLGLLGCDDPAVYHSLKNAIVEDSDERVQYEAAKSLISLGCLEDELVQILVDYLIVGNPEVRLDMLKTLCNARGISYISKSMPSFDELVKVLAHLCKPLDNADLVSFEAAIAFGKICVKNIHAVDKMFSYLNTGDDTHKKAVALRILVKQFNECSWNLVEVVLKQFTKSPVWEHRREAAQLLQHLGRKYTCSTHEDEELVYSILERRLWDDSVEMVRMESANTLGVLNMYGRAAETVIKRLSDSEPSVRAHAVTSLGTLGIKQPKVLRVLSEMLELDPSDTVRREIIRAFGSMQLTDKKIIRLLKERERGDGMLAQEAKRVLKVLEAAS